MKRWMWTIAPATIIFNPENRKLFLLKSPKKTSKLKRTAKTKATEIKKACQIVRKSAMTKRKEMM